MMVVLEMAHMAAANRLSVPSKPSMRPEKNPIHATKLHSMSATRPPLGAMRISRRMLNSSPSENMMRMTPTSERGRARSSETETPSGAEGPTMSPASK